MMQFLACKLKFLLVSVILLLFVPKLGYDQTWVKMFSNNNWVFAQWITEAYDHGYILLSDLSDDNGLGYLWIIKTDINGNILWEKKIGTGLYHIVFGNIEQTSDGGLILAGGTNKYDINNQDPILIKLNACGELDWCSVIHTQGRYDFATRCKPTLEGGYVMLTMYSDPSKIVNLFKFNSEGNLLWKKNYHPDTLIFDEEPWDVRADEDGYLISSMSYYSSYPGGGGYEHPYFIKTDTSGNLTWWLVYGSITGYHGYSWDATQKSSSGNYYSFVVHSNYCDTPGFVKLLSDGTQSYNHDLLNGLCPGGYWGSLNFVDDSTIITHAYSTVASQNIHKWLLLDTLGNLKQSQDFPSWIDGTAHTVNARDRKFISLAQVNDHWLYLYKLKSDLTYDSIYTHPFVYDSLCPVGVISDTIDPNCDLIVGIDEPQIESIQSKMKVYPNPASGILIVEFPKYLQQVENQSGMTSSSVFYQWNHTSLEVFNDQGKKIFEKEIPKPMTKLQLNISSWQSGVYLFTVTWNNKIISNDKVIIQ
jgi:hypothetical protein